MDSKKKCLDDTELFSPGKSRFSIKKIDLINDLRSFKGVVGDKPVGARDYRKWENSRFSVDSITRQFGSWVDACEEVGLTPKKIHKYDVEDLLDHFENVWRWRGQRVVINDLNVYNKEHGTTITYDAYKRRWGSFVKFVGIFSKYKLGQLSLDDVKSLILSKNKRVLVSPRLRSEVLNRDNYRCTDCGASPRDDDTVKLHIHHIIPVSKGGETEIKNLTTNCSNCNLGKSDKVLSN